MAWFLRMFKDRLGFMRECISNLGPRTTREYRRNSEGFGFCFVTLPSQSPGAVLPFSAKGFFKVKFRTSGG